MNPDEIRRAAEAWCVADPDPSTAEELRHLLDADDLPELADRVSSHLEFGTAGLRAVIGAGPARMNRAVVRTTTAGLARYLKMHLPAVSSRGVVVGRDARRMSLEFAVDAAGVFAAEGIPVLFFEEPVPTPLVSFAVTHLRTGGGVMITASHNPPEYNGYKVYWDNGAQVIPPHEQGISESISRVGPANQLALLGLDQARQAGLLRPVPPELRSAYLDSVLASRRHLAPAPSLKIAYSALHGVGGSWIEEAMKRAGFEKLWVVAEQHAPDGRFPTVRFPNPEEPGAMDLSLALAEQVKADLLLVNDPDADRLAVGARDRRGALRTLTGNEVGVLLGHYLLTRTEPRPKRPLVISTIASSPQLGEIARRLGARYAETLTGFKWIANRALQLEREEQAQFLLGFEEALGYCVGLAVRDKDGITAALAVADMASWCASRESTLLDYLEQIQREHGVFVSVQKSVTYPGGDGAATIAGILDRFRQRPPLELDGFRVLSSKDYLTGEWRQESDLRRLDLPPSNVLSYELSEGARVTLRPSGTEPKIKYYFELAETVLAGEPVDAARDRAGQKIKRLQQALGAASEAKSARG
jgi:phosphomannomutase